MPPRGFQYRLEAWRAKVRHIADGKRLALARCHADLREAQSRLLQCVHECERLSEHARVDTGGRIDAAWALQLTAIAMANEEIRVQAASAMQSAERAVEQARADLAAALSQLEALDQHRDACIHDYSVETARREAKEADHDWLSRPSAQGRMT